MTLGFSARDQQASAGRGHRGPPGWQRQLEGWRVGDKCNQSRPQVQISDNFRAHFRSFRPCQGAQQPGWVTERREAAGAGGRPSPSAKEALREGQHPTAANRKLGGARRGPSRAAGHVLFSPRIRAQGRQTATLSIEPTRSRSHPKLTGAGGRQTGLVLKRADVSAQGAHAVAPLLLSAFCLLPTADCLLPAAYCRLPTAYCRLSASGSVTLNVEPSPGWLFTDTRPP
jgi:hypothetical protein